MTDEFESNGASAPGRRDRIEGTTELGVGIGKHMRGAEGRRTEILLKTKGVQGRTPLGLGRLSIVVVTVLGQNEAVQYISRSRSEQNHAPSERIEPSLTTGPPLDRDGRFPLRCPPKYNVVGKTGVT